jgi:mRNA interferase HicA
MKYSEFRRYLKSIGVTFAPAKGSHFKLTWNGRVSYFPDHDAKEMKTGWLRPSNKTLASNKEEKCCAILLN